MIFRKFIAWLALASLAVPALAGSNLPLVTQSGQTRQLPAGTTLATQPSTTSAASLNVPAGTAPSSPNNGDIWTTSSGIFARLGGTTARLLPPCPQIENFGGAGDNLTLNDTAFSLALAASLATKKCVTFGPGQFKFANEISVSLAAGQSLTVHGSARGSTALSFASGKDGFVVNTADNTSSIHLRDLSILTQSNGSVTGLKLTQATQLSGIVTERSDLTNVTFRGADGMAQTNYWGIAITQQASNYGYHNVVIYGSGSNQGTGIAVQGNPLGTANDEIGIVADVSNSGFYNLYRGFVYGTLFQGVQISGSNFTAGGTCIYQAAGVKSTSQLSINNSQFDCDTDIDLESGVNGTNITGSYFIGRGNASALILKGTYNFNITGNYFENVWTSTPTSSRAITVSDWAGGFVNNDGGNATIDNNVFNAWWNAVTLQSTSRNVSVGVLNVFDQPQGDQITNSNTSSQNCIGVCKIYNLADTLSYTPQTGANVGLGTGGSYSAPACNSGLACDSISGEVTFTTGNTTGTGLLFYVNLPSHTNKYACVGSLAAAGDTTNRAIRTSTDQGHLYFYAAVALAANVQHYAQYVCGGN